MSTQTQVPAPVVAAPARAVMAAPAGEGMKAQMHSKLLDMFQSLYAVRALTRFSVAVLGCPVEGAAFNIVNQIRVGAVKALFFPADEAVDMRIAAGEPGCFTLHVFTLSAASIRNRS